MKKTISLLFCVVAMAFAANASDNVLIDRCMNVLLNHEVPTGVIMAPGTLDVNHDGAVTISDLTMLIDQSLQQQAQGNRAPAQQIDVEELVNQAVNSKTGDPNIQDVNKAIDQNLKNQPK